MKWIIYEAYGAWCADNGFGDTIWSLNENELIDCLNMLSQ